MDGTSWSTRSNISVLTFDEKMDEGVSQNFLLHVWYGFIQFFILSNEINIERKLNIQKTEYKANIKELLLQNILLQIYNYKSCQMEIN